MKRNNEKGLGLVEVVAALGISVVVITSLVSLTVYTLRSSQRSKALLEASKKANQTLELVRAFRDSANNWIDDVGEDGFIDILDRENCDAFTTACSIDSSLAVTSYTPKTLAALGPTEVDVFFYAYTPLACADDNDPEDCSLLIDPANPLSNTVRIAVFANTRLGDEVNTTSLYTDLTNWRGN